MAISQVGKFGPSKALNRTLSALDESCKQAIALHLKQGYNIDPLSEPTLSQTEDAIYDMFDEGGEILLARLRTELRQETIAE